MSGIWFSTNILGNRDGEVLDDPGSFKTKEESKLSVLEHILQPELYPELYSNFTHKVRINYYPPRGDNKEGWDNIDIFGWLGPIVLDLVLFMDLAQRSTELRRIGIQEWLSFYFKSPMCAPGLYSEHDLFIQLMLPNADQGRLPVPRFHSGGTTPLPARRRANHTSRPRILRLILPVMTQGPCRALLRRGSPRIEV